MSPILKIKLKKLAVFSVLLTTAAKFNNSWKILGREGDLETEILKQQSYKKVTTLQHF